MIRFVSDAACVFALSSLLHFAPSFGQDLEWARQVSGTGDDVADAVAVDASGNLYTTGYFEGTADFDPGPGLFNLTSAGGKDIFISKLDSAGNFVWAKQLGGEGQEESHGVTVDGSGNVFTTGYFRTTADFDPGGGVFELTATGLLDIFISKLDSAGNFVWARHIRGGGNNRGKAVEVDQSGNVYATGNFEGTVDLDPGVGVFNVRANNNEGIFVCKLDSDGDFVWGLQFGGGITSEVEGLAIDGDRNLFTVGRFRSTVDFDPGLGVFELGSTGNTDIFLSKLDQDGQFVWARRMGGTTVDRGYDVAVGPDGDVYSTGAFFGTADFDPGSGVFPLTANGNNWDIFVSRLSAMGDFVWARRIGGSSLDLPSAVAVDADGNVFTTGRFQGTVDFDPNAGVSNLTSDGIQDAYISRLDSAGNFAGALRIGGSADDWPGDLALGPDDNLYAAGSFKATADFDPGSGSVSFTALGEGDVFVAKYSFSPPTCSLSCSADVPSTSTAGSATLLDGGVNVSSCTAVAEIAWTFGDGTSGSSQQMPVHTFQSPGTYNWTFDVSVDEQVCSQSGQIEITDPVEAEPAQMVSPPPGSMLNGATQQFLWTQGSLVTEYRLSIGSTPNGNDVYSVSLGTQTSVVVSNLPMDGRALYASLESLISGEWSVQQVQYTAASASCSLTCSATVPTSASTGSATLFQSSATPSNCTAAPQFSWSFGDGTVASTEQLPIHVYENPGNFDWSLDVTANGATCRRVGQIEVDDIIAPGPARLGWAKRMGGAGDDGGRAVAVDGSGNVYTTGVFSGTVDFDPGTGVSNLTSAGGTDVFVAKFDNGGQIVWARRFGGTSFDASTDVAFDGSGNVYTTGRFFGPADFDPGPGVSNLDSPGSQDIFVAKLDSAGNFVWARQLGGPGNDHGNGVAVDGSGNVYTTGYFSDIADLDPGPGTFYLASSNSGDVFVSKLDSAGDFVWAVQFGNPGFFDIGYGIALDSNDNVYTAGNFNSSVDFDPGPGVFTLTSAGSSDIFVSKLNSAGKLVWARQLGGTGFDVASGVAVDATGNVLTTGSFQGIADFDPGAGVLSLTSAGSSDIFISKLRSSGSLAWARQFGGPGSEQGRSVAADLDGNVYSTGYFAETADFSPGTGTFNLTSMGGDDIFVSKLDNTGNFVWANQTGGSGSDWGFDLAAGGSDSVYTTGEFESRADFDPGAGVLRLSSAGGNDIFLAKYTEGPEECSLSCSAEVPATSSAGSAPIFSGSAVPQDCTAPAQFSWSFGDGTTAFGAQLHDLVFEVPGEFNWSLEVSVDGQVCSQSGTITIDDPLPTAPAQLVEPASGSVLTGSSQLFEWTQGANVTEYLLRIGSTPGSGVIFNESLGLQTSVIVSGLPTDGRELYVRLESKISDVWIAHDVQLQAAVPLPDPVIVEDGIVLANLLPTISTISPLSIFTVFGENFSTESILYPTLDDNGNLERMLGGVCLEMNGERLPIFAVTPTQINAQASGAQVFGPASLTVITNCDAPAALNSEATNALSLSSRTLASPIATVTVEASTPAFFLYSPLADNGFIAARFNSDAVAVAPNGVLNDQYGSSRPAIPGDIVVLYGSGWGQTEAALAAGELATDAAELLPSATSTISFGGVLLAPEDILYVGVTPGTAGLFQAAIRIPVTAQPGNNQVVLTTYGKSTPVGPVVPVTAIP